MNEYELTVLIHPDLEATLDAALGKIKALITDNGGEITKEDTWGKKRLAYTIKSQDFAIYQYYELKLPSDAPLRISNVLNITEEALRYLLVKTDEKTRQALAEERERAAKREASSDEQTDNEA